MVEDIVSGNSTIMIIPPDLTSDVDEIVSSLAIIKISSITSTSNLGDFAYIV